MEVLVGNVLLWLVSVHTKCSCYIFQQHNQLTGNFVLAEKLLEASLWVFNKLYYFNVVDLSLLKLTPLRSSTNRTVMLNRVFDTRIIRWNETMPTPCKHHARALSFWQGFEFAWTVQCAMHWLGDFVTYLREFGLRI